MVKVSCQCMHTEDMTSKSHKTVRVFMTLQFYLCIFADVDELLAVVGVGRVGCNLCIDKILLCY